MQRDVMDKEEALKEARRLLKKSGVDTSEMTDAEVLAKIGTLWKEFRPKIERIYKWINDELIPVIGVIFASFAKWYDSLPEEVRAELGGD